MLQEQTQNWTKEYLKDNEMFYPAEYVVRMFKGNYPRLNLKKEADGYMGKSICDIGFGDGRHLALFKSLGFDRIAGTEISQDVVDKVKKSLEHVASLDLRVGINNNLGFEDGAFDFLLSWNVCYYLDDKVQFTRNYTQTAKRAADNKRRYAPGKGHSACLLWGYPKGAAPHLAHDFAKQSVVCYTLCRRCRENAVAAGEGKGI